MEPVVFEAVHCTIRIERPSGAVLVVAFQGRDVGELGERPFRELEKDLAPERQVELFIDAREGRSATIDVSAEWAHWLATHRKSFRHVSMLTGSRFVQLSAEVVRKFADLDGLMRIYTDPAAFEGALASSVANDA